MLERYFRKLRARVRRSLGITDLQAEVTKLGAEQTASNARTMAWIKEAATQIGLLRQNVAPATEVERVKTELAKAKVEISRLTEYVHEVSSAQVQREARAATWTKEAARQLGLIRTAVTEDSDLDYELFRSLDEVRRDDAPIIVGPWLSEVGFELLYWIPFLQWFVDEFSIDRSRIVAVSRGGVGSWYAHVADRYFEIFDHFSAESFRRASEARALKQDGSIKQYSLSPYDEEIVALVKKTMGIESAKVLHPSVMYSYFQPFWAGAKSQRHILARMKFKGLSPVTDPVLRRLPEKYVAAKFYTRTATAKTPRELEAVRRFVGSIASTTPIVSMDTRLAVDEHESQRFEAIGNVLEVGDWFAPATNLHEQTAIVANAEALIGTYGGFTYLPILFGKPSVGIVLDDPHLLTIHGSIMYSMVEQLGGSVTALDYRTLDISPGFTLPALPKG